MRHLIIAVLLGTILSVSTGQVQARASDACFIDPRATMRALNREVIIRRGLLDVFRIDRQHSWWSGDKSVQLQWSWQHYRPTLSITGYRRGSLVEYFDYDVDGKIDRVYYRGKARRVTFDAESDACEIYERVMRSHGIHVWRSQTGRIIIDRW